jgi:DhnA family fructose-bisphosphate aldolase class Ia
VGSRVFEKLDRAGGRALIFAADALVSGGVQGLGRNGGRYRTRPEFLELIRRVAADGAVDGILMTPADAEQLAQIERLFDGIDVTPIVRMNAETNLWNPRFGNYRQQYSLPFSTVPVLEAGYCDAMARNCRVQLGLYSITLNNDVYHDEATLNAYLRFAQTVGQMDGFAHFLEVFLPNTNRRGLGDEQCGAYVADSIVRTMSYLRLRERPLLIKTEYTTPAVWRELCAFDPTVAVGALGGPRTTTRNTLRLAADVVANGGRAVLFGRSIFDDEDPGAVCLALRAVLDGASVDDALVSYPRAAPR